MEKGMWWTGSKWTRTESSQLCLSPLHPWWFNALGTRVTMISVFWKWTSKYSVMKLMCPYIEGLLALVTHYTHPKQFHHGTSLCVIDSVLIILVVSKLLYKHSVSSHPIQGHSGCVWFHKASVGGSSCRHWDHWMEETGSMSEVITSRTSQS